MVTVGLTPSKRCQQGHLGACLGRKRQRKAMSDIFLNKSKDPVVPWNVNGIPRGEVTTISEHILFP